VIYISYPFLGFLYSSIERLYNIFNIPDISACTYTYTCTHDFQCIHMCVTFPGSAARTIALFEEHFCHEQSMNLSFDCRNNSDQIYLTKENDLSRKVAESGGRISKESTTGYYISQSILRVITADR